MSTEDPNGLLWGFLMYTYISTSFPAVPVMELDPCLSDRFTTV